MASKVQIVNQALIRLGANTITDFLDQTVEAKAVNRIYEMVVDDVISRGPWQSAKRRETLALVGTTPVFGFTYAHQLPVTCLKVLRINECRLGDIPYKIENNLLLTNEPVVSILYLSRLTSSSEYDTYLRQAIVWQLCYELAYLVMGDKVAAQNMLQIADNKILDLLNNVSSQDGFDILPSDSYIDERTRP